MNATSLQLATAMGAIANGGNLMRPYVVKAVVDSSGRIVEKTSPTVVRRVVSRGTSRLVREILKGVVSQKGTGAEAAVRGFQVAGKTGTSQKVDPATKRYSRKKHVATFVGFAPADEPKLVILAMVDEPQGLPYGGLVAGPVFAEVAQWSLNYFRVSPQLKLRVLQDGLEKVRQDIRRSVESAVGDKGFKEIATRAELGLVPDFRGLSMREVLTRSKTMGFRVNLKGTGLAFAQKPAPGSVVGGEEPVVVRFRPPR
jgi:cell division protein FtsI (penicillin-binding protein 3)